MPFALPPIEGLHGILPIIFLLRVIKSVFAPIFAAANAASSPACPPPMTITS